MRYQHSLPRVRIYLLPISGTDPCQGPLDESHQGGSSFLWGWCSAGVAGPKIAWTSDHKYGSYFQHTRAVVSRAPDSLSAQHESCVTKAAMPFLASYSWSHSKAQRVALDTNQMWEVPSSLHPALVTWHIERDNVHFWNWKFNLVGWRWCEEGEKWWQFPIGLSKDGYVYTMLKEEHKLFTLR